MSEQSVSPEEIVIQPPITVDSTLAPYRPASPPLGVSGIVDIQSATAGTAVRSSLD
jgi:hypothetical protein